LPSIQDILNLHLLGFLLQRLRAHFISIGWVSDQNYKCTLYAKLYNLFIIPFKVLHGEKHENSDLIVHMTEENQWTSTQGGKKYRKNFASYQ
jgi:hypothetical protein